MTTPRTFRVIHWDDPEVRAAEERADNPLRSIAELPRVWFDGGVPKPVKPGQTWAQFAAAVKAAGIVFMAGMPTPTETHLLVKKLARAGVDCAKVKFITDWEGWGKLTNPRQGLLDFAAWFARVEPWPGPVGNYGNAEGEHVEEHPYNEVALSWPWLRDIDGGGGVSCPTCYDLGLSPNGLAKTIAVARSIRRPNPPKRRPVVVFIKNPSEYGPGEMAKFLAAAASEDRILWGVSPLHEKKYRGKKAAWVHAQNVATASAIGRGG